MKLGRRRRGPREERNGGRKGGEGKRRRLWLIEMGDEYPQLLMGLEKRGGGGGGGRGGKRNLSRMVGEKNRDK